MRTSVLVRTSAERTSAVRTSHSLAGVRLGAAMIPDPCAAALSRGLLLSTISLPASRLSRCLPPACRWRSEEQTVEGADRELRKSRDATNFATDGPAPRRYDGRTTAGRVRAAVLSGVNTPTRSSVTASSNLRRARRTSTAPSVACSSLRLKLGEQLLCCSHALHS